MKPVKQTKFGPVEGNCFAACLASLLEVEIDTVEIDMSANKWFDSVQEWLKPRNLFFLEVRIDVAVKYPFYAMNGIYCIMSGKSPRVFDGHPETNHCVVGMINSLTGGLVSHDMIHDPHPDNTYIRDGTLWGLGFLCKLDPSKP